MPALIHKAQVLLTGEQHRTLLRLAKERRKPLSALLREAVVEQLLKEVRRVAKRRAAEEIASMRLPVTDWPKMEEEIERAHTGGRKRR